MLTKITRTALIAATAATLFSTPALARGGNPGEENRAKIEAARAASADCKTASLWEMMFGHDDSATAQATPVATTN